MVVITRRNHSAGLNAGLCAIGRDRGLAIYFKILLFPSLKNKKQ
jgi:hypothetical protein